MKDSKDKKEMDDTELGTAPKKKNQQQVHYHQLKQNMQLPQTKHDLNLNQHRKRNQHARTIPKIMS